MTKLQYLLRAPPTLPVGAFRARVLDEIAPRLLADGPSRLKLTVSRAESARLSVIPYRRDRLALLSIWDEAGPDAAAGSWTSRVLALGGDWSGYRVRESVPLDYRRDWPDGAQTPGVGMLTLLRRRPGLSDEEFLRRWHEGHSSLALRIHPLWAYVRNVVEWALVPGSPSLCGIVEEQVREPRDLLSPVRFFGGALRMLPNMLRVLLDVRGFLDLGSLENYLVTEHWLRS